MATRIMENADLDRRYTNPSTFQLGSECIDESLREYVFIKYNEGDNGVVGSAGDLIVGLSSDYPFYEGTADLASSTIPAVRNRPLGFLQADLEDGEYGWAQKIGPNKKAITTDGSIEQGGHLYVSATGTGVVASTYDLSSNTVATVGVASQDDSGTTLGVGTAFIGIALANSSSTGSSTGEANTADNVGSSGVGLAKQKVGVSLQLYKLASYDSKLAVSIESSDHVQLKIQDAYIDHDNLLNYNANEHFAQTSITKLSSALSTGLVKVTNGTGNISIISDSSSNWDDAYTHSTVSSGNPHSVSKSDVGLSSVENTALSTWAGSSNITTLGTITTGVWSGTPVTVPGGGTGAATLTGYIKGNGTSAFTAVSSIPNTDITGLGTMSTQDASAVAITGGTIVDITSFRYTDGSEGAGKVATSDANGNVSWQTPIGGGAVDYLTASDNLVDVRDYGAAGDGSDDTVAIQAAIAACSAYDILYFPAGTYKVTSTLVITTEINIRGEGYASQIYQASDLDLFYIDGSSTSIEFIFVRDIYLLSAATSSGTALLDMIKVGGSYFENIMIAGGYYGFYLRGCLRNSFQDIKLDSSAGGYGSPSTINTGIRIDNWGGTESNANVFDNLQIRGGTGFATNGLYYDGGGEGNIKITGSTIEGIGGVAVEIVNAYQSCSIIDSHVEGDFVTNAIKLTNCALARISNCIFTGAILTALYFRQSSRVEVDTCRFGGDVDIDYTNSHCEIHHCTEGTISWNVDPMACRVYAMKNANTGYYVSSGSSPYLPVNIVEGSMETWAGSPSLPTGFTYHKNSNEVTQETTDVLFGSSAAKVTVQSGQTMAAIRWAITNFDERAYPDAINYVGENWSWALSGSGTNEYYLQTSASADPELPKTPLIILENGIPIQEGTAGSLTAGQWDYGDNDGLGYETVYVRLSDDADPDSKDSGYVKGVFKRYALTLAAWAFKPASADNGVNPSIYISIDTPWGGATHDSYSNFSFTLVSEQWTRIVKTIYLDERAQGMSVFFGIYSGSPNDCVIFDGIEILEGESCSPRYCEQ